jgi:hypothetical protein
MVLLRGGVRKTRPRRVFIHSFNILLQIYQLARETVVLLLECNPDIGPLLDWVVDRCYTGTPEVADGCFVALATIFSAR